MTAVRGAAGSGAGTLVRPAARGFLAGFAGGLCFLVLGLGLDTADVFTTAPSRAFAVALLVRSAAVYGGLFGVAGFLAGGLLRLISGWLGRRSPPVFSLVLGGTLALVAFAYLTVWWQIDVLSGLPIGARQRLTGAFWQLGLAAAIGAAVTAGAARAGRGLRGPAGAPAVLALALAVSSVAAWVAADLAWRARAPAEEGWRPEQVVLVGLDGLTFRVLAPLLRAGELPTFERLVDEGAWGSLLTYGVASSPVVWTSIATGKKARDHGITDFVTDRPSAYRARFVRSTDRRVPALWNVLSHAGRTVAVVDWLATEPPERVNGAMVTGLSLRRRLSTSPPRLERRIAAVLDRLPAAGGPDRRQIDTLDRVFAVARHLLRRRPPASPRSGMDFLAVYDRAADTVQHRLWKYYRPERFDAALWEVEPDGVERHGDAIPEVYRRLDLRLGELIRDLDDDALLIVVSDHGQLAARRPRVRFHLDRVLAALGLATLEDGRLVPSRSRAYTLVETRFSARWRVNVNAAGREREGVVPAGETARTVDEVVAGLRAARLADGTPLFGEVEAGRQGADVHVSPSRFTRRPRYLDRRVTVGGAGYRLADFAEIDRRTSGDHDHQGVIFLHGRGVRPGPIGQRVVNTAFQEVLHRLTDRVDGLDRWLPLLGRLGLVERATTLDVTPTILHALGLPVARDMAGRPLTEVLAVGHAVREVATYDDLEAAFAGEPEAEDSDDEEVLEHLKDLGYVN